MKRKISHTPQVLESSSVRETQKQAEDFARKLLQRPPGKHAFVAALKGELGSGKTTFVQGFAKGLGIKEKILSPTFLIVKRFQVSGFGFHDFYHIDCYRLQNPKELLDLGWKEIVEDEKNIVAVEWADRVKSIVPKHALWLSFFHAKTGLTKRSIVIG